MGNVIEQYVEQLGLESLRALSNRTSNVCAMHWTGYLRCQDVHCHLTIEKGGLPCKLEKKNVINGLHSVAGW